MRFPHAAVTGVVVGAVLATAGSAPASSSPSTVRDAEPVMRYAKTSVVACRARGGGFTTATFSAANRGAETAYAKAWAVTGQRMEIGGLRLAGGEGGELGEFGTTGSVREVRFHLTIRSNGVTRTKVVVGGDLPHC